jgi:hypothetical protein
MNTILSPSVRFAARLLVAGASCIAATANLGAWSAPGHQTVGLIGYALLSPTAKTHVDAILAPSGGDIAAAATWPDDIKPLIGKLSTTPEGRAFNKAHADNKKWHYVNFPVGSTAYALSSPYATDNDLIHTVQGCIDVLEGRSYNNLSSLDALRYLVHLVGDVHQPLHTIDGFYDVASDDSVTLLMAGDTIPADAPDDQGGNLLHFTGVHHLVKSASTTELHALFDNELVADIALTKDSAQISQKLLEGLTVTSYPKGDSAYRDWVIGWAGDSMKLASDAYAMLTYGDATPGAGDSIKDIEITLSKDFVTTETAVVSNQLKKGGVHLAQLLNAIRWPAQSTQ